MAAVLMLIDAAFLQGVALLLNRYAIVFRCRVAIAHDDHDAGADEDGRVC